MKNKIFTLLITATVLCSVNSVFASEGITEITPVQEEAMNEADTALSSQINTETIKMEEVNKSDWLDDLLDNLDDDENPSSEPDYILDPDTGYKWWVSPDFNWNRNNGYGAVDDRILPDRNGKKFIIYNSDWTYEKPLLNRVITVAKGTKYYLTEGEKKSFASSNPAVAKVNSKGMISAKKAGVTDITYTYNGKKCALTMRVKDIALYSKNCNIKKLKAEAAVGTDIDVMIAAPLNIEFSSANTAPISNYKCELSEKDGFFHITGKAATKGSAKIPFTAGNKKYTVQIKIKDNIAFAGPTNPSIPLIPGIIISDGDKK